MNITGERLRELRKQNHKTLIEVGKDVQMSYSNLAAIERGEQNCNSSTLKVLADYYGVSTDFLMGKDEVKVKVFDNDGKITEMQTTLLDATKGFTTKDFERVLDFVDFVKSKKESDIQ